MFSPFYGKHNRPTEQAIQVTKLDINPAFNWTSTHESKLKPIGIPERQLFGTGAGR